MKNQRSAPKIGEIYLARFDGVGNEQRGIRPALVIQNNTGNLYSPNVITLPLTTSVKKIKQPTHVLLPVRDTGLIRDSVVLCENPVCMSKERLGQYITSLSDDYMQKIAIAYLLATSAISFVEPNNLRLIWERAQSLNAA